MDFYFFGFIFRGIFSAYRYNIICTLHLDKNYTIFTRMNCYDLNINGSTVHRYCAENYLFINTPILFPNKTSRSVNL